MDVNNDDMLIGQENLMDSRKIDLHVHTAASDGKDSPKNAVRKANMNGIKAIAITDHDTTAGVKAAILEGEYLNLEVIPGIELSAKYNPTMHILGLYIDIENIQLKYEIDRIKRERMRLIAKAIKTANGCIKERGIRISLSPKVYLSLNSLRNYLIENHVFGSQREAEMVFADIMVEWKNCLLTPEKCIDLIHDCGGMAFLAHPIQLKLNDDELKMLFFSMKGFGLDGVEILHPKQSVEDTNKYLQWCKEFALLCSGGSDYHGDDSRWKNSMSIPYSYLERIKHELIK